MINVLKINRILKQEVVYKITEPATIITGSVKVSVKYMNLNTLTQTAGGSVRHFRRTYVSLLPGI